MLIHNSLFRILLVILTISLPRLAQAKRSFPTDKKVKILSLGVTQFGVGDIEIEERKEKLARKLGVKTKNLVSFLQDNPRKLKKILKARPVLTVIGPEKKLYIVDHHHWLRLLLQLDVKEVYYTLRPDSDFSALNYKDFFRKLAELELIYNYDEDGVELDPQLLVGMTIANLQNYNWRGLVGLIRDKGGIIKVNMPFFEFKYWVTPLKQWHLRHYGQPDFSTPEGIETAVHHGLEFAASEEAQKIPGHVPHCDILLR